MHHNIIAEVLYSRRTLVVNVNQLLVLKVFHIRLAARIPLGHDGSFSPVNLWFDLDKIATENLFVGNNSHTHPEQHIKNIEQSK